MTEKTTPTTRDQIDLEELIHTISNLGIASDKIIRDLALDAKLRYLNRDTFEVYLEAVQAARDAVVELLYVAGPEAEGRGDDKTASDIALALLFAEVSRDQDATKTALEAYDRLAAEERVKFNG